MTELGEVPRQGSFRDTLLETLAVVRPSRAIGLEAGIRALGNGDGQLIAVLGELTAGQAQELSAARHGNTPALALILSQDQRAAAVSARTLTGGRVAGGGGARRRPGCRWRGRNCTEGGGGPRPRGRRDGAPARPGRRPVDPAQATAGAVGGRRTVRPGGGES